MQLSGKTETSDGTVNATEDRRSSTAVKEQDFSFENILFTVVATSESKAVQTLQTRLQMPTALPMN